MKTTKRAEVFETNSSSSHSISISNGVDTYDTIGVQGDGVLVITKDSYNSNNEPFGALDKAGYAAVAARGSYTRLEMLEEVLKEQTGAKEIIYREHGSSFDDEGQDAASEIFMSKIDLKDFIFNRHSEVSITYNG